HGEEEAVKAQTAARAIFSAGDAANMPSAALSDEDFTDGVIDIISVLVKGGLVATRSEGRRAVEQGGVSVDGEKITDFRATFSKDSFADGKVVKRGKKTFKKITL
ncbi:MAG: tyrosine--tRNA ligase, partial [Clostridia bacterium]|nr:tyrosine--tRNA ligase [Clostridia bacterium]